jgi:hypothetical protein
MDMRVVRVPVIDGHLVEPRAEIALHLFGQITGKSLEVGHLAGVLGRDDEPKMVAVVLAPFREGRALGAVAVGIEHLGPLATPGDAIALQI